MDNLVIICSLLACLCSLVLSVRIVVMPKINGKLNGLLVLGLIVCTNIVAVGLLANLLLNI